MRKGSLTAESPGLSFVENRTPLPPNLKTFPLDEGVRQTHILHGNWQVSCPKLGLGQLTRLFAGARKKAG